MFIIRLIILSKCCILFMKANGIIMENGICRQYKTSAAKIQRKQGYGNYKKGSNFPLHIDNLYIPVS